MADKRQDDRDKSLSPDVLRRVEAMWPEGPERRQVCDALATYGVESYEREVERVRLAILKLGNGDPAETETMVVAAKRDYRDVLMWAEYPEEGRATWSWRLDKTEAQKLRLEEIRERDRKQYKEWLKAVTRTFDWVS